MLRLPDIMLTPSEMDTLDRIGAAFHSRLDRDGAAPVVVILGLVTLILVALFVRWIRREAREDGLEREALDARHRVAMSTTPPPGKTRRWVHVPAHLRLSLHRTSEHGRVMYEDYETQSVSAAEVAFLSRTHSAKGSSLWFTLYLGEKWPLSLRGVVSSVEPSSAAGGASLVTVTLGPISNLDTEHLVRWVAHEDGRRVADARRGRVCAVCGRPLVDDKAEKHATCLWPQPAPLSKVSAT